MRSTSCPPLFHATFINLIRPTPFLHTLSAYFLLLVEEYSKVWALYFYCYKTVLSLADLSPWLQYFSVVFFPLRHLQEGTIYTTLSLLDYKIISTLGLLSWNKKCSSSYFCSWNVEIFLINHVKKNKSSTLQIKLLYIFPQSSWNFLQQQKYCPSWAGFWSPSAPGERLYRTVFWPSS